jgi:tetratricopeptide (TPR) repeat protein
MTGKFRRGATGCAVFVLAIFVVFALGAGAWTAKARGAALSLQSKLDEEKAQRSLEQSEKLGKAVEVVLPILEKEPDFMWRVRRGSRNSTALSEDFKKIAVALDELGDVRDAVIEQDWARGFNKRNDKLFAAATLASAANFRSTIALREEKWDEALKHLGQALGIARVLQEHPTAIGASIGSQSEIRMLRTVKGLAEQMPREQLARLEAVLLESKPEVNPKQIWQGELMLALGYYDRKQEWLLSDSCTEPILKRLDLLGSAELAREEAMGHWNTILEKLPDSAEDWTAHLELVRDLEKKIKTSKRGYVRNLAFDEQYGGASTYESSVVLIKLASVYLDAMAEGIKRIGESPSESRFEVKRLAPLMDRQGDAWSVEEREVAIEFRRQDVVVKAEL